MAGKSDSSDSSSLAFYRTVVRQMMFANGDFEDPIPSCIDLVLDVTKYQMVKSLENAWQVTKANRRSAIMLEDILVQFKHHKFILKRLLQFARAAECVNELKRAAPRTAKLDEERDEESEAEDELAASTSAFDTNLNRMKSVADSMNLGTTADELLEAADIAFEERKKRIAQFGDELTSEEFLRFTEARQATFRDDSKQKIKIKGDPPNLLRWLGAPQCENVVSFVLAFIGREVVAQFVDAAVAIRKYEEPNLFLNDDQHGHVASPNQRTPVQVRHYSEALRRCIGWRLRKDFLFGYYKEEDEEPTAKRLRTEEYDATQS